MAQVPAGRQLGQDVLHEQHLGGAGLEGEVLLRVLALLAAEGRVGQDHVELLGRLLEQRRHRSRGAVRELPCHRLGWSMPCSTRLASAMGNTRFSFSRPKKVSCLSVSMSVLAGLWPELAGDVLVGDGEEAAGAAAGVVHRLPELRVDRVHHGADHLARGEELAAVGVLLAHLQQQVFVHLRQGEEVRVVDVVDADLVDLVEDVAQVGLGVHPHPLHRRHDAADDALLAAWRRVGQAGARVDVQAVQVGQQFLVDEVEQLAVAGGKQLLPLPAEGLALRRSSGARAFRPR